MVSAGYDEEACALELEFRSGHVYRYESVPASVYDWLLRIENKGSFVRRMLQGRYVEQAVPRSGSAPASARSETPGDALEAALRASLERLGEPSR